MDLLWKDRIAGALYGVAVGDALGAPLEFMSAEQITKKHGRVTEMIDGGWLDVLPGETTDDTAMTLAVAEGIIENQENPLPAIGDRFIRWLDSNPKDIGVTCSYSIHAAKASASGWKNKRPKAEEWFGVAQLTAQKNNGRSGGNGALMQTIYPALFYPSKETAILIASDQGRMTHWDDESEEACQLYVDMVHHFIGTEDDNHLRYPINLLAQTRYNLTDILLLAHNGTLNPTGYVVDSLSCALNAFSIGKSFVDVVTIAVNRGGDGDTIAAVFKYKTKTKFRRKQDR